MKPYIGAAALAVLALGGIAIAISRPSSPLQASQPQASSAVVTPEAPRVGYVAAPAAAVAPAPTAVPDTQTSERTTVTPVRKRVVNRNSPPRTVRHTRSAKKSALIIGGSAAGGAVIGGLIDGKKGAIIGAVVGGAGGTVYDRKTRHRRRNR